MDMDTNTVSGNASDIIDHTAGDDTATKPKRAGRVFFRICAVAGFLCAVAGWLLFYSYPATAVTVGGIGACASVAGLWSGRGCLRSVAVTGIIVAVVMLLVYFSFYYGIAWGVSHL